MTNIEETIKANVGGKSTAVGHQPRRLLLDIYDNVR